MFELSIAAKYLTPRWRQLSVSIITMISILVIAMVVWLIVVFFSVTNGLTSGWIEKLVGLTAPIRITPTERYYDSYYYQVDGISSASDYTSKTIGEKLASQEINPYDPAVDEEIPSHWLPLHLDASGNPVDPVKTAFSIIQQDDLMAQDYELTVVNLKVRLLRQHQPTQKAQGMLNQSAYVGSIDKNNPFFSKAILSYSPADIRNILGMSTVAADQIHDDAPERIFKASQKTVEQRLKTFFHYAKIDALQTPQEGMRLPVVYLPENTPLNAWAFYRKNHLIKIFIYPDKKAVPSFSGDLTYAPVKLLKSGEGVLLETTEGSSPIPERTPIYVAPGVSMKADLISDSLATAATPSHLRFQLEFNLQGTLFSGAFSLANMEIAEGSLQAEFDAEPEDQPFWLYRVNGHYILPSSPEMGEAILLPKSFRDAGAYVGDGGLLSYFAPGISAVQEQRTPVYVAGFYDPGILPIGGKFILVDRSLATQIRTSQSSTEALIGNGINVQFTDWDQALVVKKKLEKQFDEAGIARYWKIQTFREFEFSRDILQQLDSEKRLFSMLAAIIIIVACSNIISMLIILVNDKKVEIGILRSLGASGLSIATIFGCCGVVMGFAGSLIGTTAAFFTLQNLHAIVGFISRVQGSEMFNPMFYGDKLPTEVSMEAFLFVLIATVVTSLISGLVPAIKACMMKPSAILKAE